MTSYGEPVPAKNGTLNPHFANGKPVYSSYNPERDAQQFAQDADFENAGFIIICGLASGLHVSALRMLYPEAFIAVIEDSEDSLQTLYTQFDFSALKTDPLTVCTTPDRIDSIIRNFYLPALYGNCAFKALRSWADVHRDIFQSVCEAVQNALVAVSADYSVQARFGKIWQSNILKNLSFWAENSRSCVHHERIKLPLSKKAAIIAAGPSLDTSWQLLEQHRDDFFIICTDTALHAVASHGIQPDAFATIDGQLVSHTHFMADFQYPVLGIIDLCAHPAAARLTAAHGGTILFTQNGHPFCSYIDRLMGNDGSNCFLPLYTGSGTVTIAAIDFAVVSGFSEILLFGTDFCYHAGKPYAKSTYLDTLYRSAESRIHTAEQQFASLLYRTPLQPALSQSGIPLYITKILASYGDSLSAYIRNIQHRRHTAFYSALPELFPLGLDVPEYTAVHSAVKPMSSVGATAHSAKRTPHSAPPAQLRILPGREPENRAELFRQALEHLAQELTDDLFTVPLKPAAYALLPLAAWLQTDKRYQHSDKKTRLFALINLAKKLTDNYTV